LQIDQELTKLWPRLGWLTFLTHGVLRRSVCVLCVHASVRACMRVIPTENTAKLIQPYGYLPGRYNE